MQQISDLQTYVHASRYARWIPEQGRRETWAETVTRLCDFWANRYPAEFPYTEVYNAVYNMEVMPSMRSMMTAGAALERDNISGYNCAYVAVDDPRCFDEIMFVLMNGTGVGYSVERQSITKLPEVAETFHDTETIIRVADSKQGWASALRQLISLLYSGQVPRWDTSGVRPAGARLKTFGGRASGPAPLVELFTFAVGLFKRAAGRKLTSVECSDLVCKIAQVVVVGGVRRSALICLSNLTDERMRNYKSGQWWVDDGQRALANISAAYTEKPDIGIFMKEWTALYESKSGERGIFNRVAANKAAIATGRREPGHQWGTNPCGEIVLRPNEFCNLSEVVVRSGDTFEDLQRKVRVATILGTFQSSLVDFRYLRKVWADNCKEERLLGVSLTGIMDHPVLSGNQKFWTGNGAPGRDLRLVGTLEELRELTISTNKEWSEKLGIEQSAAITTIKPSGTVSQLVDSASGIHPRYSKHYIRTVRADAKDPLATFLKEQGVPVEPDVTNASNLVFSFPVQSPDGAVLRNDITALEQLEHYLVYKKHWCEHNPSITVYVREHEWLAVGAWVYQHLDDCGGVSFLPHSDHVYQQAPYQEIDSSQYAIAAESFPKVDWGKFDTYEVDDSLMQGQQEFSCSAGVCEVL